MIVFLRSAVGTGPRLCVRGSGQGEERLHSYVNIQILMAHVRLLVTGIITGIFALVVGGAGCSMLSNPNSDESPPAEAVLAEVDSLDYPAEIAPSDTLRVDFHGTVGPDGCYSFDRFDVERTQHRLTVTPVVRHTTADDVGCTMAIVPLDRTFTAAPPFAEGVLTLVVPQPNGEEIRVAVTVAEASN